MLSQAAISQELRYFNADFQIKEINQVENTSTIIIGKVILDNILKQLSFEISFPEKEYWLLQDSLIKKFQSDTLISTEKLGNFDDLSVFNELLKIYKNDYGLEALGFTIKNIKQEDELSIIDWSPSKNFESFISYAQTTVKNNLLHSFAVYDNNNMSMNTTFFSNYVFFNGKPIPKKIRSKTSSAKFHIFKSIEFENIVAE